jgi:hypothetical protein
VKIVPRQDGTQHKDKNLKISIMPPDAECSYAYCHVIPIVMLSVIMLTVNMLSAIMMNVIMVSVGVPQKISDRTW